MNTSRSANEPLKFVAVWRHGKLTLRQFAARTLEFLERFDTLRPEKFRWTILDPEGRDVPLARQRPELTQMLMDCGWDRQEHWAFLPSTEEESPTPDSTSLQGYGVRLFQREGGHIEWEVYVRAGAESGPNANVVTVRIPSVEQFESPEFLRALMSVVIRSWWPDEARLSTGSFTQRTNDPNRFKMTIPPVSIGWMTYIRRPGIQTAVPPGTMVEQFGEEGAMLITLDGGRVYADCEAQVEQAIAIRESLRAHGMLDSQAHPPKAYGKLGAWPPLRARRRDP